jgi:hypothetical protein
MLSALKFQPLLCEILLELLRLSSLLRDDYGDDDDENFDLLEMISTPRGLEV